MNVNWIKDKWNEHMHKHLTNLDELNDLGCIALDLGEIEYALSFFKTAVETKATVQSLNNLAYIYFHEGDYINGEWHANNEEAINLLKRAISLKPTTHYPYSLLGRIYLEVKKYDNAVSALVEAVKHMETVSNLNNLGVALYKRNEYAGSASYFEKAHKGSNKQSSTFYPYYNLGLAYSNLGKYSEVNAVADFLIDCEEVKVNGSIDILDIVTLYYLAQNYNKVISLFQSVLDIYILSPLEFQVYLNSLFNLNMYREAEEFLMFAIDNNKERIEEITSNQEIEATNRLALLNQLNNEIKEYEKIYQSLVNGIELQILCEPYLEEESYLLRNRHP